MMMLVDKGFYDYDYKQIEKKKPIKPRTDKEMNVILSKFGFNTKLRRKKPTAEELQKIAMNELDNKEQR